MNPKLREIYAKIPKLKCVKGCTECCGNPAEPVKKGYLPFTPLFWSRIEVENIREYLKKKGIKERLVVNPLDPCPYIENGKCLIHPARPLMCRLFGVVEDLKCPYVKPKSYIKAEEATELIQKVYEEELNKGEITPWLLIFKLIHILAMESENKSS
jgi:Fe-S-cluster containining protein